MMSVKLPLKEKKRRDKTRKISTIVVIRNNPVNPLTRIDASSLTVSR